MRQQINLYQGALIDKPEPFQSRLAALILMLTVVCLGMVATYDYWQTSTLKKMVEPLQVQQQNASELVASLEQKYPERQPSSLLQEKINRLEREIGGQRRALNYFSAQGQTGNSLILEPLESLARYRQPGVWLQRISLLQGGREVQLVGNAIKPEQVPAYLQLLGDKNVFGGQVFGRLQLNRLQESSGRIEFTLDSVAEVGP